MPDIPRIRVAAEVANVRAALQGVQRREGHLQDVECLDGHLQDVPVDGVHFPLFCVAGTDIDRNARIAGRLGRGA